MRLSRSLPAPAAAGERVSLQAALRFHPAAVGTGVPVEPGLGASESGHAQAAL